MVAARYRDIRFLFPYLGQLIFFLTPVFWRADSVVGHKRMLLQANPMASMVELIRRPLLGQAPQPQDWIVALGVLAVGFTAWLVFFTLYRRRIPFWL